MSAGFPATRPVLRKPCPESLSDSLASAGLRSGTSAPLVIERGWPLAKIPLLLRCSEPGSREEDRLWWSFYFLSSEKVPFVCRSALENRTATYLDDLHAVVQSFPRDMLLSGVEAALTRKPALEAVQKAIVGRGDDWQSLTAQVLNYKSSRRLTLRYRLMQGDGRESTRFCKLYSDSRDGESWQKQQALEDAVAMGTADQFSVPQLLGRVPQWNALLWHRAPGEPVSDLLRSPSFDEIVSRVARCLGNLHGSHTGWSGIHGAKRELGTVRSWLDALEVASPESTMEFEAIYRRLHRSMSTDKTGPLVPSHRDFYDKQILVDEDRCTLLDLEVASRAEAELDVGNFLAHLELRWLQGRMEGVASSAQLFVTEYSRVGSRLDAARLRWYLASSLLRLGCVYSFRPEWVGLAPRLLEASMRALDGDRFLVGERA